MDKKRRKAIHALRVKQWLPEWEKVPNYEKPFRRKPEPYFYLFRMSAVTLSKLTEAYERKADKPRSQDTYIQRKHIPKRSEEIRKFIEKGYPWSSLSEAQQRQEAYQDQQMPGWLPTAIIVNVLRPGEQRNGNTLTEHDAVYIEETDNPDFFRLILPDYVDDSDKTPGVPPFEVIDGQHRLKALAGMPHLADFELPVVAFYDLDRTWQAYLFYTINIKPKKINPSLAYDLYPLLRVQEWLEKSPDGSKIYRDARAQEIVEVLWSHQLSPWRDRISMLGERIRGKVTQASFVQSLVSSFLRGRDKRSSLGGIFASPIESLGEQPLEWTRYQQAAFVIWLWRRIAESMSRSEAEWALSLRKDQQQPVLDTRGVMEFTDPTFSGKHSLLATDQGVRGVMLVANDLCYLAAQEYDLNGWKADFKSEADDAEIVLDLITEALESIEGLPMDELLGAIALEMARFDWRLPSTPNIDDEVRRRQSVYKGSSGYRQIRLDLLSVFETSRKSELARWAKVIKQRMGYENA